MYNKWASICVEKKKRNPRLWYAFYKLSFLLVASQFSSLRLCGRDLEEEGVSTLGFGFGIFFKSLKLPW